jgi:hypothetical protein
MPRNKIEDLRDHLFETIEMLKDGDMDIQKAKAIKDVAQTIVNSAKVEVDFLKFTKEGNGSGFFPIDERKQIENKPKQDGN